ncbi:tetratricopeptide repeat protein [Evansella sp. AB-rgal1]|uniref:tetratricopeptide repeat protein n=1 Tax=Evansella sp. AB-rgal1 TaxID=3242696 RepID=UPI00359E4E0D
MRELNSKKEMGKIIPFLQDGAYFYRKGIEAYQNRQIEQALQYINKAIRIEPEEPVFLCQLAIVLSEKGEFETANDLLQKVITEVDESMAECYFFMANNLAHVGKFELAKLRLNKYLQMDPEGEFAEDAHSLLYMLEEELEFLEDFGTLSNYPSQLEVIVDLIHKGDYDSAEKEARGYLMENPKEWDVYAYLAESLMYQGEMEHAKSILQDLLIKDEPNFLAQCIMTVLLAKEDHNNKDLWIKNLVNLRPIKDWHCYYLAKTLYCVGEYEKSYQWFKKLFQGSQFLKLPAYFHQMAICAWKNGHEEKARGLWERIREMDSENENIANTFLDFLSTEEKMDPSDVWFTYQQPKELLETME